jgi:hypothetical protein
MLSFSAIYQWATAPTSILEVALVIIAWKRKLYRQLTFFFPYIILLPLTEIGQWWVSVTPWYYSESYSYVYWSAQFVLSLLRLLTIGEIARRSLRGYPAIWAFAWRTLSVVALLLLSWTTYSGFQNSHHFRKFLAIPGERFEFMQAILLLLLLSFGVYYRVQISRLYRWILIGICIYSSIQVADSQILFLNNPPADSIFSYIRRVSFMVPMAIWTYAVWRWGADSTTPPDLISQSQYDELSPQIHDRLRDLNDKLSKLRKH